VISIFLDRGNSDREIVVNGDGTQPLIPSRACVVDWCAGRIANHAHTGPAAGTCRHEHERLCVCWRHCPGRGDGDGETPPCKIPTVDVWRILQGGAACMVQESSGPFDVFNVCTGASPSLYCRYDTRCRWRILRGGEGCVYTDTLPCTRHPVGIWRILQGACCV
jgi:hypothetical protein